MVITTRHTLVACACALFLACAGGQSGPKADAPQPVSADAPAAERAVGLFERLAYDLKSAGENCDQVAAHLSTFTQTQATDYPALIDQAWQAPLEAEVRSAHDQRLSAAMATILTAVEACAAHPGAQSAFTQFDLLVDPR